MAARRKTRTPKEVTNLEHREATRRNIPTAEFEPIIDDDDRSPLQVAYERRNRDLDPQLVWKGKDAQDLSDLVVQAPPLFIQEKIHPKALIDDLIRRTEESKEPEDVQLDLFDDFNGLPTEGAKTEFYQHDANWTNRMILGDSLQVMASLAEREGLCGKVQCIYLDPPYGIGFNSNFQWSTTSRTVMDGKVDHITREPEQVRAFRDTWRDGIHSYLTFLRDRLTVARDLLTDSGSIFVQIGADNVHRLRSVMDEIFGNQNFVAQIAFKKMLPLGSTGLPSISDYILWFAKDIDLAKLRNLYQPKPFGSGTGYTWIMTPQLEKRKMTSSERKDPAGIAQGDRPFFADNLMSSGYTPTCFYDVNFEGQTFPRQKYSWKTNPVGMARLIRANRILAPAKLPNYLRYFDDFAVQTLHNMWDDTHGATSPTYVVQTSNKIIERCILMATDPGDLILDPTCGSGTAAYVAEQWGRRWITIDTSRVALALARARIMGARYSYYLLTDSPDGREKEAEITRTIPPEAPTYGDIRQGFVCERVPHIMLRDVTNNAEIDVIWEEYQEKLEPMREGLNEALGHEWEEWEIPREAEDGWSSIARDLHAEWWEQRIARQNEIDASIAAKAKFELLYDKPYEDSSKVRVAGPFTVESVSPHRTLGLDVDDELIDHLDESTVSDGPTQDFATIILETLRSAGVQQAHKDDRITFSSLTPWPGELICGEGRYADGDDDSEPEKRAAIFIGPEFGTVGRQDLVTAAHEAEAADFDVLIACAFSYDAHSTELDQLGTLPILKARMNADLHMATDLKNTGSGNLFVIFGEPDIEIVSADGGQIQVKINGVDVFHPNSGEVRSDNADGIACWFIDTDYNQESFFVRQAYFLGANDPYGALKTSLKAEIDRDAWETLHSDTSRPFDKPTSGQIAVKVINHLGDEVLKVFRVD
ncbi:MAG: site-specific DNA-methyltransferase [Chloroflexi bacterium]|nr:site-specific DNA-methyltransferase [Chloroflexota bacterium]